MRFSNFPSRKGIVQSLERDRAGSVNYLSNGAHSDFLIGHGECSGQRGARDNEQDGCVPTVNPTTEKAQLIRDTEEYGLIPASACMRLQRKETGAECGKVSWLNIEAQFPTITLNYTTTPHNNRLSYRPQTVVSF